METRDARALTRRGLGAGLLGAAAAATAIPVPAAAQGDVELLLVLLNDGSGSIDEEEYRLQREGTAAAIEHPQVLRALRGAVAVAYGEWGSPGGATLLLPWTRIANADDAANFAGRLVAAPRAPQTWNAIGDAIASATEWIRTSPFRGQRAAIDVAGDGPDMRSAIPAPAARDLALAAGITINALAIQAEGSTPAMGARNLRQHYEDNVIGGPGAFVMVARDRADFAHAIFNKLVREVS